MKKANEHRHIQTAFSADPKSVCTAFLVHMKTAFFLLAAWLSAMGLLNA